MKTFKKYIIEQTQPTQQSGEYFGRFIENIDNLMSFNNKWKDATNDQRNNVKQNPDPYIVAFLDIVIKLKEYSLNFKQEDIQSLKENIEKIKKTLQETIEIINEISSTKGNKTVENIEDLLKVLNNTFSTKETEGVPEIITQLYNELGLE